MNDIKTLIRSSIVSLIIVIFGLFMLCVGRSPQLNLDGPLVEGGAEADSNSLNNDDFLSLLDSSGDEDIATTDNSTESTEDIFAESTSEAGSAEAGEDDLSDIMKLLESVDDNESETAEAEGDESGELEKLLYDSDAESGADTKSTVNPEDYANLESEINNLEKILSEKDSQIDNIKQSIQDYDSQIASIEGGRNYPGGATSNMQFASQSNEMGQSEEQPAYGSAGIGSGSSIQEQYDLALTYFHNAEYQSATATFQKILHDNRFHELSDNCQYWIGECQYARGNFYQAIVEFEKVFSFDETDKQDDAQIMIALAYMKNGQSDFARSDFSWLLSCYETSEYYQRALRYMKEL